jgi:inner membrane protein
MHLRILHALECSDEKYVEFVKNTPLGVIFSNFSPNLHVKIIESDREGEIVLRVIDLRYFFRNEFLHQATLVIDQEFNLIESYFHPYSLNNAIPV